MSDSLRPHGLQPTRLLHPWDFSGKSAGVGCHCRLHPDPGTGRNRGPASSRWSVAGGGAMSQAWESDSWWSIHSQAVTLQPAMTWLYLKACQGLPQALRMGCKRKWSEEERGGCPFPREPSTEPSPHLRPPVSKDPMKARPGLGSVSRVRTCPVLPGPSKGNAAPIPPSGLTHYPQPLAPAANRGSPDTTFTSPAASAPTSPDPPTFSRPPT